MTNTERYIDAARKFSPNDRSALPAIAHDLRAWVEGQARTIRALGPRQRLRCVAYITLPRQDGELVSCEFLGSGESSHSITVASSGSNHLVGREPHTIGLNASISLVALLANAVGVPVTLQP